VQRCSFHEGPFLTVRRIHFFEIADLPGCPALLRDAFTDYLRHAEDVFRPYLVIAPLLRRAIERSNATRIIDLCSGAGGPWLHLLPALTETGGRIGVCLTDKFINRASLGKVAAQRTGQIELAPEPVDATAVPESLAGFRTLFGAFHHFPPPVAGCILADAVRHGQGIGIFEMTQRTYLGVRRAAAILPLVFFWAPLIRPFRWSRFLLTWAVPLMPLIVTFDSIVSSLRTYTPAELLALARAADPDGAYHWEAGEVPVERSTVPVTYLTGIPKR